MILLLLLGLLAISGIVATLVNLRTDGYRQVPTDWIRVAERSGGQAGSAPSACR